MLKRAALFVLCGMNASTTESLMRLLVVEDDPDLNRQLATALTDAGYVVDRAFDGEEGHYLGETDAVDEVFGFTRVTA